MLIAYDFLYATSSVQPSSLCTNSGLGNPAFAPSITELPPPPAREGIVQSKKQNPCNMISMRLIWLVALTQLNFPLEADEPNWQGLVCSSESNESVSTWGVADEVLSYMLINCVWICFGLVFVWIAENCLSPALFWPHCSLCFHLITQESVRPRLNLSYFHSFLHVTLPEDHIDINV